MHAFVSLSILSVLMISPSGSERKAIVGRLIDARNEVVAGKGIGPVQFAHAISNIALGFAILDDDREFAETIKLLDSRQVSMTTRARAATSLARQNLRQRAMKYFDGVEDMLHEFPAVAETSAGIDIAIALVRLEKMKEATDIVASRRGLLTYVDFCRIAKNAVDCNEAAGVAFSEELANRAMVQIEASLYAEFAVLCEKRDLPNVAHALFAKADDRLKRQSNLAVAFDYVVVGMCYSRCCRGEDATRCFQMAEALAKKESMQRDRIVVAQMLACAYGRTSDDGALLRLKSIVPNTLLSEIAEGECLGLAEQGRFRQAFAICDDQKSERQRQRIAWNIARIAADSGHPDTLIEELTKVIRDELLPEVDHLPNGLEIIEAIDMNVPANGSRGARSRAVRAICREAARRSGAIRAIRVLRDLDDLARLSMVETSVGLLGIADASIERSAVEAGVP